MNDTKPMEQRYAGDKWSVSPHNYSKAIRSQMTPAKHIKLADVTIREGAVQAGVKFTIDEQCRLVEILDDIGVSIIGMHLAPTIKELVELSRRVRALNPRAKIQGGVHPFYEWKTRKAEWKDVVNAQIDNGVDIVEMMYFLTDWRLKGTVYQEKLEVPEIIKRMDDNIAYVKDRGATPFVSVTDTSRVPLDRLLAAYTSHVKAGAEVLAVNDSFGSMIPLTMRFLVSEVKKIAGNALVKVHCHNDVGLSLANTLAAVEAGADIVDGALNGYGDRGFADLTAIAVNLTINYGYDLGIKLDKLYEASKAAEAMTGMPIDPRWPLVGDYAYSTSHELHQHAMQDNYWSGSVLDTRLYGKTTQHFLTTMSGPIAFRRKLDDLGIALADGKLDLIMDRIHKIDDTTKGIISDDKLREIVASV